MKCENVIMHDGYNKSWQRLM